MDVRIGVTYVAREIQIEMSEDADSDAVRADVDAALGNGSGELWLTDRRGHQYGVPVDKIAYVEVGSQQGRRIGFASE